MIKKISEFNDSGYFYTAAEQALLKENGLDLNDETIWDFFPDLKNKNRSLFDICCSLPKIKNVDEAADIIKRNISSKHFCIMGDYDKQI